MTLLHIYEALSIRNDIFTRVELLGVLTELVTSRIALDCVRSRWKSMQLI